MTDAEHLRMYVHSAKQARNRAQVANAEAENAGEPVPFSADDLGVFRRLVHVQAAKAREAGVDISDLVGDNVGVGPSPD